MKQVIGIKDVLQYTAQRGLITTSEYVVMLCLIKNANGADDYNAIGRCIEILSKKNST